jgi:hypothetical protein
VRRQARPQRAGGDGKLTEHRGPPKVVRYATCSLETQAALLPRPERAPRLDLRPLPVRHGLCTMAALSYPVTTSLTGRLHLLAAVVHRRDLSIGMPVPDLHVREASIARVRRKVIEGSSTSPSITASVRDPHGLEVIRPGFLDASPAIALEAPVGDSGSTLGSTEERNPRCSHGQCQLRERVDWCRRCGLGSK